MSCARPECPVERWRKVLREKREAIVAERGCVSESETVETCQLCYRRRSWRVFSDASERDMDVSEEDAA